MFSTATAGQSAPEFIGQTSVYPEPDELHPQPDESTRPYWLTIAGSGRHIKVPSDGELVLGRFDPHIGIPPDIDLGLEDIARTISRRHAKIVGRNGFHTVEDLGSSEGIKVNGAAITAGTRHKLESGDRIKLGKIQMVYEAVPTHILIISPKDPVQHIITVASTGSQFEINPPDDVIIGRRDTFVDFIPDIDLGEEGEVSSRVSRRHVIITWRDNMPYVEDHGSGFGTRLNGKMLLMGQAKPLKPGDHLWLGGCVLGYDVRL
jgi:pSer/pThr/pTyr-binding forkhead associated (FHA) protein